MATKTSEKLASKISTQADGTVVSSSGVKVGKAAGAGKKGRPAASENGNGQASKRLTGGDGKTPAERRLLVVKAMRKLAATGKTSAVTAGQIAEKAGLTRFDVYGQLYHTHKLQTEKFAEQVQLEGARELSYYLTAKGAKATDEAISAK